MRPKKGRLCSQRGLPKREHPAPDPLPTAPCSPWGRSWGTGDGDRHWKEQEGTAPAPTPGASLCLTAWHTSGTQCQLFTSHAHVPPTQVEKVALEAAPEVGPGHEGWPPLSTVLGYSDTSGAGDPLRLPKSQACGSLVCEIPFLGSEGGQMRRQALGPERTEQQTGKKQRPGWRLLYTMYTHVAGVLVGVWLGLQYLRRQPRFLENLLGRSSPKSSTSFSYSFS